MNQKRHCPGKCEPGGSNICLMLEHYWNDAWKESDGCELASTCGTLSKSRSKSGNYRVIADNGVVPLGTTARPCSTSVPNGGEAAR